MFTYSSKLSIPKMFLMSPVWDIFWIGPLSVNFKFTALLKNQSEWILPVDFNWWRLYVNRGFSWDILSLVKNLLENCNSVRLEDLSYKFFWSKRTFGLCLQQVNLIMTWFRIFKRWNKCSCSGVTLTPVRDKAL